MKVNIREFLQTISKDVKSFNLSYRFDKDRMWQSFQGFDLKKGEKYLIFDFVCEKRNKGVYSNSQGKLIFDLEKGKIENVLPKTPNIPDFCAMIYDYEFGKGDVEVITT